MNLLPPSTRPARILVVEDEAIVARDICQQLSDQGYEPVADTPRGEEAIELTGKLRPDLVLMDVSLAGDMDGITAARTIRARFAVPVVFLTAFTGRETLDRAKEAEPFGYIVKPYDDRDLRTVIEMALFKHRAEARLRASEARYRALTDSAHDAIVTADRAGNIASWNRGAAHMFGYTEPEVLGQPMTLLMPDRYRAAHVAGMTRVQSGGDHRVIGRVVELTGRRKDGKEFPLELSLAQWDTPEGHFVTGIIRVITERKAVEAELARREAQFRFIFESLPVGLSWSVPGRDESWPKRTAPCRRRWWTPRPRSWPRPFSSPP